jgi:hypothetical protein
MIAARKIRNFFRQPGEGKMKSKLALSVVAGMVLAFAPAAAQARDFNKLLQGEYMVTGSSSCIVSHSGFDTATLTPHPPAGRPLFVQNFNVHGARTFNGDGTGTSWGRNISIFTPNQVFPGGAGASIFTGDFTYEVHPDLTITIHQGPLSGRNLAGSGAGQTFTVTNIPPLEGRISEDLQTINVAHFIPGVEILTQGIERPRVCYRERTFTRVKRGHQHED